MNQRNDLSPPPNDTATTLALERAPEIVVPVDFAVRVTARAMTLGLPRRSPWAGFGLRTALVSAGALTIALFTFAPHAAPSFTDLRFDLELLVLAELGAVAYMVVQLGLRD